MSDTTLKVTRELWLEQAIETFRPRFIEVGYELPATFHVSMGFGYGAKRESAQIEGQCWSRCASTDSVNHIFISPEIADTMHVLEVLLHELIHGALDNEDGHRKRFAEIATRLGFVGSLLSATCDLALQAELICIAETLGEYPHAALHPQVSVSVPKGQLVPVGGDPGYHSGPKVQRNRHHLCKCPTCGYSVRVTAKWLARGLPRCPDGDEMIAD
jgi:hypothetical protein